VHPSKSFDLDPPEIFQFRIITACKPVKGIKAVGTNNKVRLLKGKSSLKSQGHQKEHIIDFQILSQYFTLFLCPTTKTQS